MIRIALLLLLLLFSAVAAAEEFASLEVRVAQRERLDAIEEELRREALAAAAVKVPSDWVEAREAESATELGRVRMLVAHLSERLDGESVIDMDLRTFLAHPHAAEVLYHTRRDAVSRALTGAFLPTDDGNYRIGPGAEEILARAKRQKPLTVGKGEKAFLREVGRMYARRLTGDADAWRKLLTSKDVLRLAALARPAPTLDAAKVILDHSEFGRMLVRQDSGRYVINRHCTFEMDEFLRRVGKDRVVTFKDVAAEVHVKGRDFDAQAARSARPNREKEVAALAARGKEILPELADVLVIEPAKLTWDSERIDLLKSSAFYNPRTGYGSYWWTAPFEDHPTARLFGTFGWTAKTTNSVEAFLAKIDARVPHLRSLAKTHDNLIVVINTMPPWLSVAPNSGTFEGEHRENAEAHPPRDMDIWCAMVRGMVARLREIEGVTWYYEFWNEPDGQYWQSGLDEFLALYAATARTIRSADPNAKVGGCAPNQWDGKLKKAKTADPIALELIRYADKEGLPLDFVSWHHFGRPVEAIAEAKAAYTQELVKHGFEPLPEFLVTEWTTPFRGMPYAAAHFGEMMLGFFRAKVDAQTIASWEEFHAKPDAKHYAPWGILTQQGVRKGTWFAHRFFDRIARDSEGIAVVAGEAGRTAVISKKAGGVLDLIVWQKGLDPAFAAALEVLQAGGLTKERERQYGTYDRLERALSEGGPILTGLETEFAGARKTYLEHPIQTPRLVLRFAGATAVEVIFAESARMGHELKRPVVLGNTVTCPLKRYEVLHLKVRIR